jgi:hypothetical protein
MFCPRILKIDLRVSFLLAMSQAAVRLSLSQKEASDLERGINVSLHSDISPSILISSGIDYEDQQ